MVSISPNGVIASYAFYLNKCTLEAQFCKNTFTMSAANDAGVERQVPPAGDIKTDFEYAEWYGNIGKELLDATYEEYQYVCARFSWHR